jgi:trigger factor
METTTNEKKYAVTVKKLPGSLVEIKGSISGDVLIGKRPDALKRIGAELVLPGFRKGHVPASVVESKVGAFAVLEEAANIILEEAVPEILMQETVRLITMPKVAITKLAEGNPLEFTITVPVLPEVTLSDYKKAAKKANAGKEESIEVSEDEIEKTLVNVRKTVAEWKRRKSASPQEAHEHVHTDQCNHDHEGHEHAEKKEGTADKTDEKKEEELPLTDEDVKMIGDYKDVADFMEKLKLSMREEKETKAKEKRRTKIADALIGVTKADVPEVMIEDELSVMMERLKHDIERMGMDMPQYLEHLKKTEADIKKEWHEDAKKRVLLQLALTQVADTEKLEANKEELEREVKRYMGMVEGADENRLRDRVGELLRNEAVFTFLESQK